MATIALRPSIFSLLITFISVLTELGLLSSLVLLNTLFQCRQLSRGAVVSIARHRTRNTLIALFSMLLFVVVEILTSSQTVTVFPTVSSRQACTVLFPLLPGRADEPGAEEALFSCIRVNGTLFTVFAANQSDVNGAVRCAESFSFRYTNQERDEQTFSGDGVMRCTPSDFCTIARARGKRLFISDPFERPPEDVDPSQLLSFLPSELAFNPTPHLPLFAQRAAETFEENIVGELDVRRFVIMGSRRDNCSFESRGAEHSGIPNALLGVTIGVWIASLSLFLVTLPMRRAVYFDMNNQMHWANRARRAVDDETEASFVKRGYAANGTASTIYLIDRSRTSGSV